MELPHHTLPSPQAFATAALAGMGWGMQLEVLVAPYLKDGTLVELVPDTPLDVPLFWALPRSAQTSLARLTDCVMRAAAQALAPP